MAAGLLGSMVLGLCGCGATRAAQREPNALDNMRTAVLASILTGSFSSAAQAEADPENYFDIRLEMVPIWRERTDGRWMYVEQAAASALDRPYRQRVYRLTSPRRDLYRSDVYELPDPGAVTGWHATPERFDAMTPDDLTLRDGCAIVMSYDPDTAGFVGSTVGTGCASALRGAAYATSEVKLMYGRLETWDRGFDADGNQVWGATEGGYVFEAVP